MIDFIFWIIGFLGVFAWTEIGGVMVALFESIVKTSTEYYEEQVEKGVIKPEDKDEYIRNSIRIRCYIAQGCRLYVAVTIYWIAKLIFNFINSLGEK